PPRTGSNDCGAQGVPAVNNKPVEAVPAELTPPPEPTEPFLVVGVGASAGGLEAFKQLLESLPDDPGLALLFVQHLEPHRPSLLRDILSRSTTLEVLDAEPNLRLDANCVYVLPPDMFMAVHDGHLVLTSRGPQRAPTMP